MLRVHEGFREATHIFFLLSLEVGHGRRALLVYYRGTVVWVRLVRSRCFLGPLLADVYKVSGGGAEM